MTNRTERAHEMNAQLTLKQTNALAKLSATLNKHHIPYVVIGGLAAIAWGEERPLADIDIQVGKADMQKVRGLVETVLKTDIRHYKTDHWDIWQMVLDYNGVGVDICQAEDFYVVSAGGIKHLVPNSLHKAVVKNIAGLRIPILPMQELIDYKRIEQRPVDLYDLQVLVPPTGGK